MVVAKKSAAKPAAKKAAKPAAKNATAKKVVAKTAIRTTSVVKKTVVEGITVTGNKKVETLLKEFNKKYPFIHLFICDISQKINRAQGGTITPVSIDKNISEVRTKINPGSITITGNKLVKTLEREFEDVFGLYVEVGFTTAIGNRYYTRGQKDKTMQGETPLSRTDGDNMTLNGLNKQCEKEGCKKDIWY